MKVNILLAEDDENLGNLLNTVLNSKGFSSSWIKNGMDALDFFKNNSSNIDLLILDVMMPGMDGFNVAENIRKMDKTKPIIFLTAKNLNQDKLEGFQVGADDYITKPFLMEELIARINAILRRARSSEQVKSNSIGSLQYDEVKSELILTSGVKKLTTKENALLSLLVRNKNEVVDRQVALKTIWGDDSYFNGRSMDVYIAKLRKMLSEESSIEILNIHGIGFKLIVK
jgi:DNA-binding response OmpR family regulator